MCSYGVSASYQHLDWTAHDFGIIDWNEKARIPFDIDKQRVVKEVINSSRNAILKVPIKRRDRRLRKQNMNFISWLYTQSNKKIYNTMYSPQR